MTNWLVNRLRPFHAKQTRWVELAEALQTYWAELFDLQFNVLANMRSIYTADESSQLRKIEEYGWYYEQDMPAVNRPIFFGMRKLDMLQKETALLIERAVLRLTGSWTTESPVVPLYALDGDEYGIRFYTQKQLANMGIFLDGQSAVRLDGTWALDGSTKLIFRQDLTPNGIPYLTSRAVIQINISDLVVPLYAHELLEEIRKIKPLHIVIDGLVYLIEMQGKLSIFGESWSMLSKFINISHPGNIRLDGTWRVGTNARLPVLRLDGTWQLSPVVRLGAVVLGKDYSYASIVDRRVSASGILRKQCSIGPRSYPARMPRLLEQCRKLDGTWPVSAYNKINGSWRLNTGVVLSAPMLGVPVSRLDSNGWESLYATSGRLDGSWGVGRGMTTEVDAWIKISKY